MKKLFTMTMAIAMCMSSITAANGITQSKAPQTGTRIRGHVKTPAKIPGAILGDAPIYNPEGTDEHYVMNVVENSWMGEMDCYGYKMTIRRSPDGKTIYFRDLTPGYNFDETTGKYGWVKGTIDGNDITIKAGQVLFDNAAFGQTLYLEAVTMNEWGEFQDFLPEVHFTIDGEYITQADNSIYLSPYKDGETIEEAGFFNFMNQFIIMPMCEIPTFTPPAGSEIEPWIMTYANGQTQVKVARDGNTVYVAGLSDLAPDDFIPGTIENGKLTFKSFYILTSNQNCYQRISGAVESEPDAWGNTVLNLTESFSFDVNDNGSFTLNPAESWIVTCDYFLKGMQSGITGVKLIPYTGDVAATPATPEITYWSQDDMMLQVLVPSEDVEGNYINPDKLTYRIYLDGELHTFSPDQYVAIYEPMTDIPSTFTDNYDIYSNGNTKTIFLHADTPRHIKIESVYTVDGDTRISAPAEMSSITETVADKAVVSTTYTDLAGRRVANPATGSIVIKAVRYTDGTTDISKEIIR